MSAIGTVTHKDDGRDIVVVKSPTTQKWILGILAALCVPVILGTAVLLMDLRAFKADWKDSKEAINKNTTFRLQGDRVTPKDLEAGIAKAVAAFQVSIGNQNDLIAEMIRATNRTNEQLLDQAKTITRIDETMKHFKTEQDRARAERDQLRNSNR